ncbi:Uncharacterized protein dnm_091860 [Desulfonema magnum]|uniref:Uncharacterized protein n=1 Tax=Desulfonema magnum TaxID=45655 RepID=A0A975GTH9_9BACT|nr:Uncharacterized protein dnm_091860 [Desulfonema magnum]
MPGRQHIHSMIYYKDAAFTGLGRPSSKSVVIIRNYESDI